MNHITYKFYVSKQNSQTLQPFKELTWKIYKSIYSYKKYTADNLFKKPFSLKVESAEDFAHTRTFLSLSYHYF